jgi:hypothetical protein
MLFTDSPAISPKDLADHETAILDTAHNEAIHLTVKILLARDEVGLQLLARYPELGLVNVGLRNTVVTPALRLWLVFHTLEIVYRDAYHNQLNDRYKAKWDEYRDLSSFAAGLLFQIGIGTVVDPIPQAERPVLSLVPGSLATGTYFVQVGWRNLNGEEGAPSELTSIEVTEENTLRVAAVNPPPNAISWNVYVGRSPEALYLQNEAQLGVAETWTAPGPAIRESGGQPGEGQEPTFLSPSPRILLRG